MDQALNIRSIAGRHEADRRRLAIDAAWITMQDHARADLDKMLRLHGLRTVPHFDPSLGTERSLWVNCRIDSANADHAWIYAVLDAQGWKPDRMRLSRFRLALDIVRIRHTPTDALLVLIIKVPAGETPHLEAA